MITYFCKQFYTGCVFVNYILATLIIRNNNIIERLNRKKRAHGRDLLGYGYRIFYDETSPAQILAITLHPYSMQIQ